MSEELSAFSSSVITPKALARVMGMLGATLDVEFESWELERDGHTISIELTSEDVEYLDEEIVLPVVELLKRPPKSMITFVCDSPPEGENGDFEYHMVRAVALALSENWPIVLDDHTGEVELISRSRQKR